MDITTILTAMFIALGFASWPIVGKYTGAPDAWIAVLTMTITTVITALFFGDKLANHIPSTNAFLWLTGAAVINGIALCLYAVKVANPAIPTAILVVSISVLVVVFAPLLDWGFNGASPGTRQMFGFVAAVIAIYLLNTGS